MSGYRIRRFFPSLAKVQRAVRHASELQHLFDVWVSTFKTEVEPHRESGMKMLVLKTTPPPIEIGLVLGDAVHALSCAMDYAVSAVLADRTRRPNKRIYFPTHETMAGLERTFETAVPVRCGCGNGEIVRKQSNAAIREAAPDLERFIIETLKPVQEANSIFWAIRKIDNIDKHNFIPVVIGDCFARGMTILSSIGLFHENAYEFSAGQPITLGASDDEFRIENPGTISAEILFGDDVPIPGLPVLKWLGKAVDAVGWVVVEFERTFGTLEEISEEIAAEGAVAAPAA